MFLIDFFKGIGHLLAKTFGLIKKLVPEEQLIKAVELGKVALEKFVDNELRRGWVADELKKLFPISDSIANLLVELAVQHIKADVIEKADEAIDKKIDAEYAKDPRFLGPPDQK